MVMAITTRSEKIMELVIVYPPMVMTGSALMLIGGSAVVKRSSKNCTMSMARLLPPLRCRSDIVNEASPSLRPSSSHSSESWLSGGVGTPAVGGFFGGGVYCFVGSDVATWYRA